jgi:gliding motility-associated lipoprotein GldH
MKNRTIQLFFVVALSIVFVSCNSKTIFDEFKSIPETKWHSDSSFAFSFEIIDTLSVHHIFINNRISGQYPYSRMYLFVNTIFPDSKEINDTIECVLAKQSGQLLGERKWLGDGFGNLYSNKIPYKANVRFPVSGTYTIMIQQGMRDEILPEVYDIGISVEKVK